MSLCRGIQRVAQLQLGAIRQPVFLVGGRKLSNLPLSAGIQRNTCLPCNSGLSRRHFWWSSKSTKPEPISSPPSENNADLHQGSSQELRSTPQKTNDTVSDESVSTLGPSEPSLVSDPVSAIPDISAISIPPPPLQIGDLKELGFCNITPVGAVQATLEFIQVTTGLPWWGTITLTALLARLAILHFSIKSTRATSVMGPIRPQIDALMTEVKEARAVGDLMRTQIAVTKLKKLQKDNGLSVGASFVGPLTHGVASIAMFIAIKKLCDFPLAQLKYEGFAWIPSLVETDPYYILPALSVAIMNLQIYLGRADMAAGGQQALHFSNGFRILCLVSFPILAQLPSGLLIYLVSNIALVSVQGIFLRNSAIRQALKIPPLVRLKPEQLPSMKDTWAATKQWFRDNRERAIAQAQEKAQVPTFPTQSASTAPRRSTKHSVRRK